jgi:hypothetical protein
MRSTISGLQDVETGNSHDPCGDGRGQSGGTAGAEREFARRAELGGLVGLHELLYRRPLYGGAGVCVAGPDPIDSYCCPHPLVRLERRPVRRAIFIGLGIFLVPQLGAATFFALLIAGQMLGSIAFDHFGLLGVPVHPISAVRVAGAALLVGGVILIRM